MSEGFKFFCVSECLICEKTQSDTFIDCIRFREFWFCWQGSESAGLQWCSPDNST